MVFDNPGRTSRGSGRKKKNCLLSQILAGLYATHKTAWIPRQLAFISVNTVQVGGNEVQSGHGGRDGMALSAPVRDRFSFYIYPSCCVSCSFLGANGIMQGITISIQLNHDGFGR